MLAVLAMLLALLAAVPAQAASVKQSGGSGITKIKGRPTQQQRQQASQLQAAQMGAAALAPNATMAAPLAPPDYFGMTPNYANSPLPPSVSIIGDGAYAVANVQIDANGGVSTFTMVNGGSGYTFAAVNVIGGGGSGGTGTPTIQNGVVTNVTITNGGAGYGAPPLAPPTVTISDANGPGTGATATATVDATGVVTGVTITNGGSGYVAPVVSFTPVNGGASAAATAKADNGVITGITMATAGSGYGSVPAIRKFVDTLPQLGAAGANDLGQYLPVAVADSTTYAQGGSGYTSVPTVTITSNTGSGATAQASIDGTGHVSLITVLTGGSGYATPPKVTITGGGGSNAYATATVSNGAVTAITLWPGSDYYWIGLVQYKAKLHQDLPATTLRGYVQLTQTPTTSQLANQLFYPDGVTPILYNGSPVYGVDKPSYLGPIIIAQRDRAVRVKFTNLLPNGTGGDLFLPVDTSIMGAGMGPDNANSFSSNRATLHLHGGTTPWISDGTQHQWTVPVGATGETYPKGVSVRDVPDMGPSGLGDLTFYYTNQQSARLLFYHDHAYGITRLNVYAGEAAGYLLQDPVEQKLVNGGTINGTAVAAGTVPADQIPLIIQDKTFVPDDKPGGQLTAEDPTWDIAQFGGYGNLWFPHVYMPNQNPGALNGANMMGRWDYGPWFWPPNTNIKFGQVANPLYDAINAPWENKYNPGTPNPTIVPEAFMDTALVNGTAYPVLKVDPKAYRFRVLNASNDRNWNLSLYKAASSNPMWNTDANGKPTTLADANAGEVPMVPAVPNNALPFPKDWTTATDGPGIKPDILDGRLMGVPDPRNLGPSWVQIGTEGGLLPNPVTLDPSPTGYQYNLRNITVLNVTKHSLFLGPAERADVVVDFSKYAGQTLILYNDGPAPVPAGDPRNDYYTGDPDMTSTGGAPSTQAGYGPNTRTIMQIQVAPNPAPAYNPAPLVTALPAAYAASQPAPVIGQQEYNAAFKANYPQDPFVRIQDTQTSFLSDMVGGITVSGGTGYTSAPTVTIDPPAFGGTTATATATLGSAPVASVNVSPGGSGYTSAPSVTFSGGGGSGAAGVAVLSPTGSVKSLTLTNGGSGYLSPPLVTFVGGGGSGAAATATVRTTGSRNVTAVTLTSPGSGYTSAPTVVFTAVNGGSGAAATATIGKSVASVALSNGGSNYSTAPTVTLSGGGGTGALATAVLAPRTVASVTITNPGSGYTSAPNVQLTGGGGTGATATATLANITMGLQPKAIQELFDPDYGRMNALLGVEIPNTTGLNQTTIPFYNIDPPTEVINTAKGQTPAGTLIQTLPDGTQVWKITHNGVDTHTIHWHMFNVQVLNRVGWDGAVRFPDQNEFGWKESVRMSPLEDIIIAVKPIVPVVPWSLPNSIRPLDPTMALGVTGANANFSGIDPENNPVAVDNRLVNFGWEYVWHCHLLGHEENDMMRSMAVGVAPDFPGAPTAAKAGSGVSLSFRDNSNNETGFQIQRATSLSGPWTTIGTVNRPAPTMPASVVIDPGLSTGATVTFTDAAPVKKATNYYRVNAINVVGDTQQFAAPAVGFPTETVPSLWSATSNGVAM